MKIILGKTKISLSFWFFALVIIMFLFFDETVVAISLISSLFHESGHLCFMYLTGLPPDKIYFGLFGMRIVKKSGTDISYFKELLISLGGIIFNFVLIAFSYILYFITMNSHFLILTYVNILIVIINSFPAGILDMGRALKYLLLLRFDERKTQIITQSISVISVVSFIAVTFFYSILKGINISMVALSIYLLFATLIKKWS